MEIQAQPPMAVFRADAAAALGGGHVMRCLTLAKALKRLGWRCAFAVNPEAPEVVSALAGEEVRLLDPAADEPEALRRGWPGGVDWLVVDHYGREAAWEAACRPWAEAILAIDDLADRPHDCNVLLDQTFGRQAADYARLVPATCRVLAGSAHALLRPGFARARPASLARRADAAGLRRLVVTLGATDPENYTQAALQGIANSNLDLAVDVVLSGAAPHLDAVRQQIAGMPQKVQLHIDVADMESLLAAADLAIGAAGTSTWERCSLGLPSLLVVIADNQRLTAESVTAAGAARLLAGPKSGVPAQVAEALRALSADGSALHEMSARAAELCDGRGADRLGLALTAPGRAKDGRAVALRLAEPGDEDILLAWQRHPTTRQFARNPAAPSAAEHHAWFTARLDDPDCLLTMITLDGEAAGMLRLDPPAAPGHAPQTLCREISILVDPERRGLGIALEALNFVRRWQGETVIAATVLPGNEASAALFAAARYRRGPDGRLYSFPPQSAMSFSAEAGQAERG